MQSTVAGAYTGHVSRVRQFGLMHNQESTLEMHVLCVEAGSQMHVLGPTITLYSGLGYIDTNAWTEQKPDV